MDIKQHDLLPPLRITVTDGGVPVDLTAASSVRVLASRSGTALFARTVTGDSLGGIECAWEAGDTAAAGLIDIEVEVIWPGQKPQTFPPRGYLHVNVDRDLG